MIFVVVLVAGAPGTARAPFVEPAWQGGPGALIRLPPPPPEPSFGDRLEAAFRLHNSIGATVQAVRHAPDFSPFVDEGFDPFADLEERYQPYARAFIRANTAEDVARIKRRIDAEWADRQRLASGDMTGLAAMVFARLLDPLAIVGPTVAGWRLWRRGRTRHLGAHGTLAARCAVAAVFCGLRAGVAAAVVEGWIVTNQVLRGWVRPWRGSAGAWRAPRRSACSRCSPARWSACMRCAVWSQRLP